jgi:hypothetical protein
VAELTADGEGSQASATSLEIATHPYAPLSMLYMVFIRLDGQATEVESNRHRRLLSLSLDNEECGYRAEIPRAFSSVEEARNALNYVWAAGLRVLRREGFPTRKEDQHQHWSFRSNWFVTSQLFDFDSGPKHSITSFDTDLGPLVVVLKSVFTL